MATFVKDGLSYTADHEWIDLAAETGNARIGITTVATDALGDVVHVELPEVGAAVSAGEACGEVESTKAVSELFAPVTGTVVAVNDDVVEDPALVNTDPFGDGWLFSVQLEGEEGHDALLDAASYAEQNEAEVI